MEVNRTELTPLLFLERAARVHASRTAAVYGRRRFTYAELGARVRRLATALRRAGLRDGDRVAFLAPNVPALLEAHFGVALAGGVLVAINTRLNADEVGYILDHSGARLLFVDAELAPALVPPRGARRALERVVTIEDPEFAPGLARAFEGPEYEAFIEVEPDPALAFGVGEEGRTYSINYTSGTTGRPKGVMYTHRGAYLNALAEIVAHAARAVGSDRRGDQPHLRPHRDLRAAHRVRLAPGVERARPRDPRAPARPAGGGQPDRLRAPRRRPGDARRARGCRDAR